MPACSRGRRRRRGPLAPRGGRGRVRCTPLEHRPNMDFPLILATAAGALFTVAAAALAAALILRRLNFLKWTESEDRESSSHSSEQPAVARKTTAQVNQGTHQELGSKGQDAHEEAKGRERYGGRPLPEGARTPAARGRQCPVPRPAPGFRRLNAWREENTPRSARGTMGATSQSRERRTAGRAPPMQAPRAALGPSGRRGRRVGARAAGEPRGERAGAWRPVPRARSAGGARSCPRRSPAQPQSAQPPRARRPASPPRPARQGRPRFPDLSRTRSSSGSRCPSADGSVRGRGRELPRALGDGSRAPPPGGRARRRGS